MPAEGEMVVIPKGQVVLLDCNTAVLEMLLIHGNVTAPDKSGYQENIFLISP